MRSEIVQVVACNNYDGFQQPTFIPTFTKNSFHYFKDYLMNKTDLRAKGEVYSIYNVHDSRHEQTLEKHICLPGFWDEKGIRLVVLVVETLEIVL
jgi:hypothetical protein